jgi:hypothetical protein
MATKFTYKMRSGGKLDVGSGTRPTQINFKKNCRRVAVDWGRKADYLEHYQLVIFVTCRDLNGRKELHIYYNYRSMTIIHRCGKTGSK